INRSQCGKCECGSDGRGSGTNQSRQSEAETRTQAKQARESLRFLAGEPKYQQKDDPCGSNQFDHSNHQSAFFLTSLIRVEGLFGQQLIADKCQFQSIRGPGGDIDSSLAAEELCQHANLAVLERHEAQLDILVGRMTRD